MWIYQTKAIGSDDDRPLSADLLVDGDWVVNGAYALVPLENGNLGIQPPGADSPTRECVHLFPAPAGSGYVEILRRAREIIQSLPEHFRTLRGLQEWRAGQQRLKDEAEFERLRVKLKYAKAAKEPADE